MRNINLKKKTLNIWNKPQAREYGEKRYIKGRCYNIKLPKKLRERYDHFKNSVYRGNAVRVA